MNADMCYRSSMAVEEITTPPEHLLTPANIMTLSRPILGYFASKKILENEPGVTPLVVAMSVSDATDGFVARYVDTHHPDSGRGSTHIGKSIDPIADTIAMLEISIATLRAPGVSTLGKSAVGIVLAVEGFKTAWAMKENYRHFKKTREWLVISRNDDGQYATFSKLLAIGAAVSTNNLTPSRGRTTLGATAIGAAIFGVIFGEKARSSYAEDLRAK
jgi:phosphatidylglycerophosphate synthase